MEEKTTYARSGLTEALWKLLAEKKINDISISELCETAGLSRLSFYRNYTSKEEILKQYLSRATSAFLKNTSVNFRTTPKKEFIIQLINHMEQHREIILILIRNDLSYLLKEAFDEAFSRSIGIYHDPYRCYVASGAYFNLVYYWFLDGCRETPEELAEMDLRI
ncbi:MAG: TetR/AcrR family transcriptional regulator [Solobacterium sp.]|nr:TetR/AcrR family transcriptional regulator [Solobacterium sp.]